MGIGKIALSCAKTISNNMSKTATTGFIPTTILDGGAKLAGALEGLATNAKVFINKSSQVKDMPDSLYHLTSAKNYEEILKSGKIRFSDLESGANGCPGVYMVDKNNFLQKWIGAKEPSLFGDLDIGEMLLRWTSKGEAMVAIELPTSALQVSKLKFRPYITACKAAISGLDNTLKQTNKTVTEGHPLSELSKHIGAEPVEYVYRAEIPTSLIKSAKSLSLDGKLEGVLDNLFG